MSGGRSERGWLHWVGSGLLGTNPSKQRIGVRCWRLWTLWLGEGCVVATSKVVNAPRCSLQCSNLGNGEGNNELHEGDRSRGLAHLLCGVVNMGSLPERGWLPAHALPSCRPPGEGLKTTLPLAGLGQPKFEKVRPGYDSCFLFPHLRRVPPACKNLL